MPLRSFLGRVLDAGDKAFFVITLLSMTGISGLLAALVFLIVPTSAWGYFVVAMVFAASLPLTFPLSAYLIDVGLSQVESARQRNAIADPISTQRRRIAEMIADAREVREQLPGDDATRLEVAWHKESVEHYFYETERQLRVLTSRYAARMFSLDRDSEYWKEAPKNDLDVIRYLMDESVNSLALISGDLPIDRRKWLRTSLSAEIAAGRALVTFLTASDEQDYGNREIQNWWESVRRILVDDAPDHAHLFAMESLDRLSNVQERRECVASRTDDLEQLWRGL